MEIWRNIYFIENGIEYDYRDYYQVSNKGNVRKIGKENKTLKKTKTQNGYLHVSLYKDKKIKKFYIHRLVAHMFLSELFFIGASVNHIDENKENNFVSNLEWCTEKYNANYGKRNDKIGNVHTGKKTSTKTKEKMSKTRNWKLVARFDLNMNLIDIKRQFEFVEMGFNKQSISDCCRKKQKKTQNFIFKYLSDISNEQINDYIIKNRQIYF